MLIGPVVLCYAYATCILCAIALRYHVSEGIMAETGNPPGFSLFLRAYTTGGSLPLGGNVIERIRMEVRAVSLAPYM